MIIGVIIGTMIGQHKACFLIKDGSIGVRAYALSKMRRAELVCATEPTRQTQPKWAPSSALVAVASARFPRACSYARGYLAFARA